ncbi:beta-galactoside alpha-2,6-sialyltransferase 2-like [Saccoglossus kowalevskii]|uniref:Beta-galactoside alpha-2,6-sialyltransferase 1 n=1 Tax=Saccoglossus kowalevskii TaxID=10224 RepID=A0A0U2USJ0_SACKO|nr:PREDICTED: beta-galactoside alpha-2,6-sialyltransferase 2-like [Saccoglossus kowalevskii]ALR88574.1 cmp-n-acetylneuraminate beta-galactoside alpha-26-sialyltransferase 2-like 146 [Saccoglossus kowalevskii]
MGMTKKVTIRCLGMCIAAIALVVVTRQLYDKPFAASSGNIQQILRIQSRTQSDGGFLSNLFNPLRVDFTGERHFQNLNSVNTVCKFKLSANASVLDKSTRPYQDLGLSKYFPKKNIFNAHEKRYNTCAIVSSSSFMTDSGLGEEIDSHEAVMRFNNAPTVGFERDVGNKTTMRVINLDIMLLPDFYSNYIFNNVSLVAWYQAPYTFTPDKWYEHNGAAFYEKYIERRISRPEEKMYVINPAWHWNIWDILQEYSEENINKHVPSSGFTGIILMQQICDQVNVYGFVTPKTRLLHYYSNVLINAPTGYLWHPMVQEKRIAKIMNRGPEEEITNHGKITLPGFNQMHCL